MQGAAANQHAAGSREPAAGSPVLPSPLSPMSAATTPFAGAPSPIPLAQSHACPSCPSYRHPASSMSLRLFPSAPPPPDGTPTSTGKRRTAADGFGPADGLDDDGGGPADMIPEAVDEERAAVRPHHPRLRAELCGEEARATPVPQQERRDSSLPHRCGLVLSAGARRGAAAPVCRGAQRVGIGARNGLGSESPHQDEEVEEGSGGELRRGKGGKESAGAGVGVGSVCWHCGPGPGSPAAPSDGSAYR